MNRARATSISKLLSFALRHNPGALGLRLDGAGWTDVATLLLALAARGEPLTPEELETVVRTSDKQRFRLSDDGLRIRANQGHSIEVDLGLEPREPPELLFHGTVASFLDNIRREGLVRGARTHVHLSPDTTTADIVARRRQGPAVILTVRARQMYRDGHVFCCSENGVWLTAHVPPEYISL